MNWGTIKAAIVTAVSAATGITDVKWGDSKEAAGWRGGDPANTPGWVDLYLRDPVAVGMDERRQAYNAGPDTITFTTVGNRKFTVSVHIYRESQNDTEETVGPLSGLLRTRIHRPDVRAGLLAANVAVVQILPTGNGSFEGEDRMVSKSVTDVVFSASEVDVDTVDAGDYIKVVEIASDKLKGPDGVDLPADDQVDMTVTGP